MNLMLERMARASFDAWRQRMIDTGAKPGIEDKGFEDLSESEREFAMLHVRAIVAAMREPTDEMIDAGVRAREELMTLLPRGAVVTAHPAGTIYRAMIDEILK